MGVRAAAYARVSELNRVDRHRFVVTLLPSGPGPRASSLRFINVTICQHSFPATTTNPHTLSLRAPLAFALPQRCASDAAERMH